MTNPVYQAALEELEAILSPRIVSRALKEGLLQVGRTADDVGIDGLETILKTQIYRQLQVAMPVVKAKDTITRIIGRLYAVAENAPPPGQSLLAAEPEPPDAALDDQREALERLQQALKPFNLYFEWAEVQKLRAQIQLLAEAQEQGRKAGAMIAEAQEQLDVVSRMLEDHLVIQARELGELREALEQVRSLGGTKVRRFESLIGQIETAQRQRQLAPAEAERARKLSRDLRKLMESSVYSEAAIRQRGDDGGVLEVDTEEEALLSIETADFDPEVTARLLLLDLEAERHDLDALASEHTSLLGFEPELAARLEALRRQLDLDNSIEEVLADLGSELGSATVRRREALLTEIEVMEAQITDLDAGIDAAELRQAIQVAKGILSTTLPQLGDIQHLRSLHRLAFEQSNKLARLEQEAEDQRRSQLREQVELLQRLATTLERHRHDASESDEFVELRQNLETLRNATDEARTMPDLVADLRRAEEAFELLMAARSDDDKVRERTRLRGLLGRLERMPGFETLAERTQSTGDELRRQLERLDSEALGDAQIYELEALVASLELEVMAACQQRLQHLAPQVADLGGDLLQSFEAAGELLERGDYPDLFQLEQLIDRERETRRSTQMDDLHALEREAKRYDTVDTEANDRLRLLLAEARGQLDAGGLSGELTQGWILLENVKEIVERRLGDFEPRLDAALEAFETVAMLNSEDVTKARRTLEHLDSQRDSMARVSIGLRTQLENALQEAETLIVKLQEEFEATRAIADQLVAGNVLDGVLGNLFGDDSHDAPSEHASPDTHGGDGDPVLALLADLVAERGVRAALVQHRGETIVAGELPLDGAQLGSNLEGLIARLADLGRGLALGAPQRITLESERRVVIASWPAPDQVLMVLLDDPTVLSLMLHRLPRDEKRLRDLLRAP